MTWDVRARDIQDEGQLWTTVDFSDAINPREAVEEVFGGEGVMISTTASRRFRVTRKPDEVLDVVTVYVLAPMPIAVGVPAPDLAFDPLASTDFQLACHRYFADEPPPPEDPPGPLTGWQIAVWWVLICYVAFAVVAVWRMLT